MISNCKRMMRSPGKNRFKVLMSHPLRQFAFFVPRGAADADQNDHAAENLMPVRGNTQQRQSVLQKCQQHDAENGAGQQPRPPIMLVPPRTTAASTVSS